MMTSVCVDATSRAAAQVGAAFLAALADSYGAVVTTDELLGA
jgi:hypothetical protein